ncbi:MAG TPA: hypothetical protein VGO93_24485 [Candidatus Xenobia bacterium]|jgi:hypothetical protein
MKKIALVGLAFPILLATAPAVAVPAVQHTAAPATTSKTHKLKLAKVHKLTASSKIHKLTAKPIVNHPRHNGVTSK